MTRGQALSAHAACPCDSGARHGDCCGPLLAGAPAPIAEALMRSRYTANALGDSAYLTRSWDASTRPAELDVSDGPRWIGLEIVATAAGGSEDDRGEVEFKAHCLEGDRRGLLHERSRFIREDGRWFYLDGEIFPAASAAVGRNAPCPCGSGRKFKRCCAA